MLGGLLTLAQDLYVEPATPMAEEVRGLFNITLGIALVIFVLVEGLLIYMIVKFRRNTKVPREETHRGHTTAEVVWTVIPAGILLFLGFLSAGTLVDLDALDDEDADFIVGVQAMRFAFRFYYPDDAGVPYAGQSDWCAAPNQARCSTNDLRVEEGSKVKLRITSLDVIHAFAVPEFAVKVDAVPGKVNTRWFEAPPAAEGTEYFVQCMEYCGDNHHGMRGTITIFPAGSQPLAWGRAPTPAAG